MASDVLAGVAGLGEGLGQFGNALVRMMERKRAQARADRKRELEAFKLRHDVRTDPSLSFDPPTSTVERPSPAAQVDEATIEGASGVGLPLAAGGAGTVGPLAGVEEPGVGPFSDALARAAQRGQRVGAAPREVGGGGPRRRIAGTGGTMDLPQGRAPDSLGGGPTTIRGPSPMSRVPAPPLPEDERTAVTEQLAEGAQKLGNPLGDESIWFNPRQTEAARTARRREAGIRALADEAGISTERAALLYGDPTATRDLLLPEEPSPTFTPTERQLRALGATPSEIDVALSDPTGKAARSLVNDLAGDRREPEGPGDYELSPALETQARRMFSSGMSTDQVAEAIAAQAGRQVPHDELDTIRRDVADEQGGRGGGGDDTRAGLVTARATRRARELVDAAMPDSLPEGTSRGNVRRRIVDAAIGRLEARDSLNEDQQALLESLYEMRNQMPSGGSL